MMFIGLAIGLLLSFVLFLAFSVARPTRYERISRPSRRKLSIPEGSAKPRVTVQILVLGDIGHSPRMQYHARSIANHGGRVSIIGYQGASKPVAPTAASRLANIISYQVLLRTRICSPTLSSPSSRFPVLQPSCRPQINSSFPSSLF